MTRLAHAVVRFGDLAHTSKRFFWWLSAAFAVALIAFELIISFHLGGRRASTAVDDIGQSAAATLAAIACAGAAWRSRGRTRAGWALIALSAFSWSAGKDAWSVVAEGLRQAVSSPSVADVGNLAAIPAGVAGLLLLTVGTGQRRERLRALVDGLLVATSLLFVSWEGIIRTIFFNSHLPALARDVNLAYPVADVVMLTIVAMALTRVLGRTTSMTLLGSGIVCLAVSDTAFAYLTTVGTYNTTPLDGGWFAGYLMVALASLRLTDAPSEPPESRRPSLARASAPYLAIGLTVAAAAAVILTDGQLDRSGIRIATVVAGLSFLSQLLMSLENRVLLGRSRANESALIESQRTLTQVIADAPVVLFSIALDGTLTLATGRALERFSTRATSLTGRRVDDFLTDYSDLLAAIHAAIGGQPGHLTVRFPSGDIDVRLLPVLEGNRVTSVSGVGVDVSEHRLVEEAQRENEAKSRFLATMSHELRTPLNSVLGFAELLASERGGPLSESQSRYVANISTSGSHLLSLINEVLDLSRIASGEVEVEVAVVALDEVLLDTVAQIRPLADKKRLQLDAGCPGGLAVKADSIRVRQVVLNLLSNAVKFTPAGGTVGVEAEKLGAVVELRVRDSGIGIAAENLERIFEEYTQITGPENRRGEGSGLGLAVSRRLAELMEGTLTVESELGRGTTFSLRLPALSEVPAEDPPRREEPATPSVSAR